MSKHPDIQVKRVYNEAKADDGVRILIDRLWPRGVSKEAANLDYWLKDLGPSNQLRKWFQHEKEKFTSFEAEYRKELSEGAQKEAFNELKKIVDKTEGVITLLYAAKNEKYNNAQVIKKMLQ